MKYRTLVCTLYLTLCTFTIAKSSPYLGELEGEPWSLRQCIEHALEHNISVKQQAMAVENSKVSLSTALNSRLPSLNASASQSFNFGRGQTIDGTYVNRNTQNTGFNLGTDIPLFTGFQIPNNIAARRLDHQAALADLQRARENVALQITGSYLDVLYQKELVGVQEQQVKLSQVQLDRIEKLFRNGKQSEADVAQARSVVANDQLQLTQQQNQLRLALLELSQLLELPTPEGFDIDEPSEVHLSALGTQLSAADIYAIAVGERPQIQAERLRLQSAERNVKIAQSGHYPTLSLNGGLSTGYYKTNGFAADPFNRQMKNNFNKYIGLNLSIPIFNRFQTRNQVRQARLQVANQQLALENTQKALYKEIQQAWYNAQNALRQMESSSVAAEAAEASFLLMQKKFENGKANSTEFEEAKTRHMRAQADHLQAKYTALFRQKILRFYQGEPLY
ncbi:MAG: TolC family protein [Bacteroidaceae bacterium]|nr:TolC family protein [Bacteroidaceae bacterium]